MGIYIYIYIDTHTHKHKIDLYIGNNPQAQGKDILTIPRKIVSLASLISGKMHTKNQDLCMVCTGGSAEHQINAPTSAFEHTICVMCNSGEEETVQHLFFDCPFANNVGQLSIPAG
jgi:hypothetical protein